MDLNILAAHGVLRLILEMNGEVVERAESHIGLFQCGMKPLTPTMPLAMSWLFPATSGAWRQLPHHKHRAKGVLSGNSSKANRSEERREEVMKMASLSTLEVSTEMNRGTPSPPLWLKRKARGSSGLWHSYVMA